jgi:hypothetical protein
MSASSSGKPARRQPRSRHASNPAKARQVARDAHTVTDTLVDDPTTETLDTLPVDRIPRRPKPATTPTDRRAAQNLLDALGGPAAVVPRLRASGDPKAQRLADLMDAKEFERTSFYKKIGESGLNLMKFTDLLLDVNNAAAVARLAMSAESVAESIIAQATDQIVEHRSCLASGRVLTETEDGTLVPTNDACFDCQGTGYVLKSADGEWVDRYLELVRLKKSAPMLALTRNVTNQNLNVHGDLVTGDGAPAIDSIIKRADEQRIMLPAHVERGLPEAGQSMPVMAGMPEDAIVDEPIEAEVVGESKV